MSKRLYVGNLSPATSSEQLKQLFAEFGTVSNAQVIEDRQTGQSKGIGFVEMSSDAEAQEAIKGLHGKTTDGRALTVTEARQKEERTAGAGGGDPRRDRFKQAFGGGGGRGGGGGARSGRGGGRDRGGDY